MFCPGSKPLAETVARRRCDSAFTLFELLIVIVIIALIAIFLVPAIASLKSSQDVTTAAEKIKGMLEQARNYALANNTYVWVGFFEENASSSVPATAGNGRLVISVVASKDGTNVYGAATSANIDATKLTQVNKLIKIDNVHLPLFAVNTSATINDKFDTRPPVQSDPTAGYNYSRFGELNNASPNTAPDTTPFSFQYPVGSPAPAVQYTFRKLLQFNPRGDVRVNGNTYVMRRVVEIGLLQTHGNAVPAPTTVQASGSVYAGNVVALQISGVGGNIKIYRR